MITFSGKLWAPMAGKGWTFVTLPASASAKLGKKGRVGIQLLVGDQTFRTSAFPDGKRSHQVQLNAAMREAAGAEPGDTVKLSITVDDAPVAVDVPADLKKALAGSAKAKAQFAAITPKARAEWIGWVTSAKQDETRARRVEKTVQRLAKGDKRPSD